MPRVLFLLQSAFSLWMLVDAMGRPGIARYWYWVVLMPFGEWFYFFKFKIHDPDFAWLKTPFGSFFDKPASLEELRFRAEETPSLENKLRLAQALHDAGELRDSAELFEEALLRDGASSDALYGLGVCLIGLGNHQGALKPLRKLLEIQPPYREYDGWARLAHAMWALGQREETLALMGRLVKMSPRLAHRIAFAYYLAQAEHRDEAQAQLATGLQEFDYCPRYLKRSNRGLAKRAREMLRELSRAS